MRPTSVTIADIQRVLRGPLSGLRGQIKMAPQPAEGQVNRWEDTPTDCREAGVLLLFYPYQAKLHLILTRRMEYPGVHSGQISFPGGRREGQELLRDTALRETYEELGVSPQTIEVIGQLSSLYTPPSNFCIYPFVAYSSVQPDFYPDEKEVAELVETPLEMLRDPAIYKEELWHFEQYGTRRVPFFDVFGHRVWGATAMILSELLTMLED